ncbi:Lrp/AsnC family transcriptional regulator [Planctomycetota bacterium]
MSDTEYKILAVLQKGLPKTVTPYQDMAQEIGIGVADLLAVLKDWQSTGRLRRIGAIVNHFKLGLGASAMVAWDVPDEQIEKVGTMLAGYKQVSHAYQRQARENWPYNLYTMVHGKNPEEVEQLVCDMSKTCGVSNYRVLSTEKELKKTAPEYIKER